MTNEHRRTFAAIFANPVRANIAWADIESMLAAAGGGVTEGSGPRVRVAPSGVRAVFHRPHPESETGKPTVRSVRDFLTGAGVTG